MKSFFQDNRLRRCRAGIWIHFSLLSLSYSKIKSFRKLLLKLLNYSRVINRVDISELFPGSKITFSYKRLLCLVPLLCTIWLIFEVFPNLTSTNMHTKHHCSKLNILGMFHWDLPWQRGVSDFSSLNILNSTLPLTLFLFVLCFKFIVFIVFYCLFRQYSLV